MYVFIVFLLLLVWKLYIHSVISVIALTILACIQDKSNQQLLLARIKRTLISYWLEWKLVQPLRRRVKCCIVKSNLCVSYDLTFSEFYVLGKHLNLCTKNVNSSIVAMLKIFGKTQYSLVVV